jgi:hypothetical protein
MKLVTKKKGKERKERKKEEEDDIRFDYNLVMIKAYK